MSTGSAPRSEVVSVSSLPLSWQRLLALSGVVFAVLFVIGWFASGGDAPDYGASDQAWTNWADDNQWKSRIGAFAMLLAGFVFLHFAGMIRSVLGRAESQVGGSAQLARAAFGGAVTGMTGMATAIVIIASSDSEGAAANPSSRGPWRVPRQGHSWSRRWGLPHFSELRGCSRFARVPSLGGLASWH
jgi:hypothetical protein